MDDVMASTRTTALPMQTDVLIVGAGPAGLTLAAGLTQLGVDHVLIERADSVQPGAKAAFVQPRALEYLDRVGVADRLVAAGIRGHHFSVHDGARTLLRGSYDNLDTPFPMMLLVSQQTTEEHLNRRLTELGGMVHRRHKLITFSPDFPGVTAAVAAPDGSVRAVYARYLIGADGVYSRVRSTAGIAFPGKAREQLFALADVRLEPGSASVLEDTTFFFSSEGMLLTSPLADGQHRVVASVPPGSKAPTAEETETLLATRGPRQGGPKVVEVITASTYHVQERVAERLSDGPVFLLGDAAHTHSPAGGQGMNTGIQDAGNLAWKLHAVLTGFAPEGLLDTYHGERHPVASGLVAFTSQITSLATMRDPELCRRRNDIIAAAAKAPGITDWLARRLSQLDISYATEPADGTYHVGQRVSPALVPAAGLDWNLALPNPSTGPTESGRTGPLNFQFVDGLETPLLIRPDGYLAAHGVPTDPHAVLANLASYLPGGPTR
ncbi:FAD-dependent monooxygenase [Kitasatospora aureofaciens]|uniref:FAD-dependent monooxygenase n=1 Tax=Kitasatospora aureofaciens TaxID=1894 RepID=UPI001C48890F|nr:FAD-dependent monooxygenase [Kitasatospora aureofaciens]MBV6701299.1 FAD-dependent monooxygenase [Kitasatospora aureofaciens]